MATPPARPDATARILYPAADDVALVPLRFRHDGFTPLKQRQFLTVLGDTGCIRDACRAVGVSSTTAYRLRLRSPEFAEDWDCALAMAATVLELAAFRRAVIGVEEPIYQAGKLVGTRRRYSDSLLRVLILRGDLRNSSPFRRASRAETDKLLTRKLDALARRLREDSAGDDPTGTAR
ncbi:MAG: hypothetical protein J0I47_01700 [Sphingomonas sp.]|uniref:hypothetical protein n=1 Tax=Sphingomonas sp. TaxID=28214 RepID=UPI001AD33C08|nr:hypothetical protein [Sphingomonas sp.]MBN8806943.1 hypothetical protein [Sphingomonas sp.]